MGRVATTLAIGLVTLSACQVTTSDPVPLAKTDEPAAAPPQRAPAKKRPTRSARLKKRPTKAKKTKPEAELACPDEMALVHGNFCRAVEQRCLEYLHKGDAGAEDESRCERFERPSICKTSLRPMRFCMDRYEFTAKGDDRPITLVSWSDASKACEAEGKRLCTESEFSFACEGEEMRPYATGFEREPDKCNIDRPYLTPTAKMLPWDKCQKNKWCAADFKRIDGRKKADENPECRSPFGIFDMNGNVNEWVSMPWKDSPKRAAIKGGWWGPVRNRCRAITMAHDETYLGYEVGFRCCKEAEPAKR